VIAISSNSVLESALQRNGYQLRERRPLVVFDAEGKLAAQPVPYIGMLEDDSSFLQTPDYTYLT
jgi:hypothetical protein